MDTARCDSLTASLCIIQLYLSRGQILFQLLPRFLNALPAKEPLICSTPLSCREVIFLKTITRFQFTVNGGGDSAVGIATGYWLDSRRVRVSGAAGTRLFSSPRRPDRLWGPSSLIQSVWGTLSGEGVKRPRHEADHSHRTSTEVSTTWIYTSSLVIRRDSIAL
jgi:hypothetical protein